MVNYHWKRLLKYVQITASILQLTNMQTKGVPSYLFIFFCTFEFPPTQENCRTLYTNYEYQPLIK